MFYADDCMIGSKDLEWIQGAINIIIRLFRRVGLMANVEKYKTMTCHPGVICMEMPAEAFIWKSKGEGVTYQDHLRRCIPFPYFGV